MVANLIFFSFFFFRSQVTTAVLSITAKAKARAKKSEASDDKMEVVSDSFSFWFTVFLSLLCSNLFQGFKIVIFVSSESWRSSTLALRAFSDQRTWEITYFYACIICLSDRIRKQTKEKLHQLKRLALIFVALIRYLFYVYGCGDCCTKTSQKKTLTWLKISCARRNDPT